MHSSGCGGRLCNAFFLCLGVCTHPLVMFLHKALYFICIENIKDRKEYCLDFISETIWCCKLILGRDIGWGCRCATSWCDLDLSSDLAEVTLTYKSVRFGKLILSGNICWGMYLPRHGVPFVKPLIFTS